MRRPVRLIWTQSPCSPAAGAAQLAGVGVALSIFNSITKLFNVPLLSVTTSAVAAATAGRGIAGASGGSAAGEAESGPSTSEPLEAQNNAVSEASSSAVIVALCIGVLQMLVLSQSRVLLPVWGVAINSDLATPTLDFLSIRCLGAPVTVLMLTLQVRDVEG